MCVCVCVLLGSTAAFLLKASCHFGNCNNYDVSWIIIMMFLGL